MYRIFDADFKTRTSLGVGGKIRRLTVAERAEEAEPVGVVLGRGTNVLASDGGIDGALQVDVRGCRLTADGLWAGAGESLPRVARFAAESGLTGLEWAAGIPGSVGGGVYGNAGAFGSSMADSLVYCEVNSGGVHRVEAADCGFSVRASRVPGVVTGACFKVRPGDREGIEATMQKYAAFRRATQPKGKTAGSTFKAADRPAGWYLERAGLKGERVGGASVSVLHANFIINDGTATADDVYILIRTMKDRVFDRFGVTLQEEIVYLGEFHCF